MTTKRGSCLGSVRCAIVAHLILFKQPAVILTIRLLTYLKPQEETNQFTAGKVWVNTETGIWPREEGGFIYYGLRNADSKPDGYGKAFFSNGDMRSGNWVEGFLCGHGVVTTAAGDSYVGKLDMSQREGHGIMTFASGEVYNGGWRNDSQHGQGEMIFANGDKYSGGWARGLVQLLNSQFVLSPTCTPV